MSAPAIVVVDAEMSSAVGLSAAQTATSTRARVQRVTEIEFCDYYLDGFCVGTVPEEMLPRLHEDLVDLPISDRSRRMLRLAGDPLNRLAARIPAGAPAPMAAIGFPEHQNRIPIDPLAFVGQLYQQAKLGWNASSAKTFAQGRASALLALHSAVSDLKAGLAQFAIVGGIDSFVDLYILGTLEMQGRIRSDRNADGFAPGEGAGFCLLTTQKTAAKYSLSPLAQVQAIGIGTEPGHTYSDSPYLGEGLSAAVTECISQAGDCPPIDCVYSSFNGERYWGKEFSVAMIRNKSKFADEYQMEHPAECCGDLGAAAGAIMLGLAAGGTRRRRGDGTTLVYCSSDYGERAAVLLSPVLSTSN